MGTLLFYSRTSGVGFCPGSFACQSGKIVILKKVCQDYTAFQEGTDFVFGSPAAETTESVIRKHGINVQNVVMRRTIKWQ